MTAADPMQSDDLEIPERFEVLETLRSSPLEVVLRARDRMLQREVHLKCPGPELEKAFRNRNNREAALREARALASVNHPGVRRILEITETAKGPLLVLEPVTGEPLHARLQREGPLSAAEVTAIGIRLAELLVVVHAAGIVHRGISTATVMLADDGSPLLTGFHFAKSDQGVDSDNTFHSSIQYSRILRGEEAGSLPTNPSPEQFSGFPATGSSDLFSLGAVLFEALSGERPFSEPPIGAAKARDLAALVPAASKPLVRAITTCLAISPSQRFKDAAGLLAALQRASPDASVANVAAVASSSTGRRLIQIGALAAVLVAAVFLIDRARRGGDGGLQAGVDRGIGGVRASKIESDLNDRYENSLALLIGIGQAYADTGFPALPNAEDDIRAIATFLEDSPSEHWNVKTLLGEEATRANVLESLSALANQSSWNDRVFLYYAGHGVPHERSESSGWMIPADAAPDTVSSWLRFDEFFRFFDEARAKHILVAMDCCYGGRLAVSRAASPESYRRRFLTRPAHVVLASGRLDEQVSDGIPGERSPFAGAFLDALADRTPTTSSLLFAKIQVAFLSSNVGHTPQFGFPEGSPTGGEFVFFAQD